MISTSPELGQTSRLAGSVALVTGASSGIGRAIALALGREGARVCAVGRNAAALRDTVKMVEPVGYAWACEADLTVDENISTLARAFDKEFHQLHILVHCAGLISHDLMRDASIENLDMQYLLNLRAPYLLTQALLPLLKAACGQIVFINSSAGVSAKGPQVGQYAATKHGLRAITDSLREEVNADGIRVLSVYPGRTATPIQEKLHQREGKAYRPTVLLQPEDVAMMVVHALMLPRTAEVTDIHIRPMNKT
jgi:NAD(P)-dependent dehydrogenase (short-subunit alcohol dehydrogenase family)